jgi:hypothetical protein
VVCQPVGRENRVSRANRTGPRVISGRRTENAAAIAALREFLPISNLVNREFGGSICKNRLNRYTPSDPEKEKGDCGQVLPSTCASGTAAGEYHTHVCSVPMDGPSGPDLLRSYQQNAPGYLAVNKDQSVRPIDCAHLSQGNIWKWEMDTSVPFIYPYVFRVREVIGCAPVK